VLDAGFIAVINGSESDKSTAWEKRVKP